MFKIFVLFDDDDDDDDVDGGCDIDDAIIIDNPDTLLFRNISIIKLIK